MTLQNDNEIPIQDSDEVLDPDHPFFLKFSWSLDELNDDDSDGSIFENSCYGDDDDEGTRNYAAHRSNPQTKWTNHYKDVIDDLITSCLGNDCGTTPKRQNVSISRFISLLYTLYILLIIVIVWL